MRKFGTPNSKGNEDKLVASFGAGRNLSDEEVVGTIQGHTITAKDVREAEEFGATLDKLVALRKHVVAHPEDDEAAERLTLSLQQVLKDNFGDFVDITLSLWDMYRNI